MSEGASGSEGDEIAPGSIASRVADWLEAEGWPIERVGQDLRTWFRAVGRTHQVRVSIEEDLVVFTVEVFSSAEAQCDGEAEPGLSAAAAKRMLQLNYSTRLARFSLLPTGEVRLSVEYPSSDLDPSEVRDAVDVLSFCVERTYGELAELLPTNP